MQLFIQRWAPLFAGFVERYLLSAVYLYFAWLEIAELWILRLSLGQGNDAIFVQCVRHAILLILDLFIGLTLLTGKRPSAAPKTLKELLVPLAASFYFMAYTYFDQVGWRLPAWLLINLAPAAIEPALVWIALFLTTLGPAFALWGVWTLGRSFGIFVAVREVVTRGPYRFVRHPMYLGYVLIFSGLALTYHCPAALILVAEHFGLFIWRARLEEARLAEFSPEYREYMKHTNMLIPRIRLSF